MKNIKTLGIIATVAIITFAMTACGDGGGSGDPALSGNITITPTSAELGDTLTANYTGSESVSYQWKVGTTTLGSGTTQFANAAGSYTVTVSASGYQSKTSAPVVIAGGPPVGTEEYELAFTPSSITFPSNFYMEGYTALPPAKTVNVWNIGTEEEGSGLLAIAFQLGGDKFEASETNLANIASGESRSFTVQPKTGLAEGTHTATVRVSSSMTFKDITLTFTVRGDHGTSVTINSAEDLKAFMQALPTNTWDNPQPVVLNLNPVPRDDVLYSSLNDTTKFVSLDLSGSTFSGNTITIIEGEEFYMTYWGNSVVGITIPASVTSIGRLGLSGTILTSITFLTADIALDDDILGDRDATATLKTAYASGGAGTYTRLFNSGNDTWTKQ